MSNYDKKMENTSHIDFKDWGFDYSEVGALLFNKVAVQLFEQLEFTAFFSESTSQPLDLIMSMPMDEHTYEVYQPRLVFDVEYQISDFIDELTEYGAECEKARANSIKRLESINNSLLKISEKTKVAIKNLNNHNN